MPRRDVWIGRLAAGVALTAMLVAGACVPATGRGTATLLVDLETLPTGAQSTVTVSGPRGFERTLASSTRLERLRPGSYTVTAPSVRGNEVTYHAEVTTPTVTLATRSRATVSVSYPVAVSDRLVVLGTDIWDTADISPDETSLSLPESPETLALRPDDIVAANPSDRRPSGIIRRIVTVEAVDGRVDATTEPASMTDAVPRGRFEYSGSTEIEPPREPEVGTARASSIGGEWLGGTQRVQCTGGPIDVSPTGDLDESHDLVTTWDEHGDRVVTSHVELSGFVDIGLLAAGATTCAASKPLLKEFNLLATPARIPIPYTPLVLPVMPKFSIELQVRGSLDGPIDTGWSASGAARAAAVYRPGSLDPSFTTTFRHDARNDDDTQVRGSMSVAIVPRLNLSVHKSLGVVYSLGLGGRLDVNPRPTDGPAWEFSRFFTGGVSLTASAWGIGGTIDAPFDLPSKLIKASAPVVDTSEPLPAATAGIPYTHQLVATGGPKGPCRDGADCKYIFELQRTALTPGWLDVTETGEVRVTAPVDEPGSLAIPFQVKVTDTANHDLEPIPTADSVAELTLQLVGTDAIVAHLSPASIPDITLCVPTTIEFEVRGPHGRWDRSPTSGYAYPSFLFSWYTAPSRLGPGPANTFTPAVGRWAPTLRPIEVPPGVYPIEISVWYPTPETSETHSSTAITRRTYMVRVLPAPADRGAYCEYLPG